MARISDTDWNSEHRADQPEQSADDFEFNQRGKPLKAVIGLAILVVMALVLSRMNPVSHEASAPLSIATGQTTGSAR